MSETKFQSSEWEAFNPQKRLRAGRRNPPAAGNGWHHIGGTGIAAIDIAAGADGSIYIVTADGALHRREGDGWVQEVASDVTAVAVQGDGTVWALGPVGVVLRKRARWEWALAPDWFEDIGAGGNAVWACFYNPDTFHNHIWQWDESSQTWGRQGGYGRSIAVGGDGTPYHRGENDDVFVWANNNWVHVGGGKCLDLGVGPDNQLWVIDSNGWTQLRVEFGWYFVEGEGVRITVDAEGLPWVVNRHGDIFQRVM